MLSEAGEFFYARAFYEDGPSRAKIEIEWRIEMNKVIENTVKFVKDIMGKDATGHDWYHIDRVRNTAMFIWKQEQTGDPFIIEMAALLHDVADEKLISSVSKATATLHSYLAAQPITESQKSDIIKVIGGVSYKGGHNQSELLPETKVVQDADRLDAMGAIGIARAFAYGGKKGQSIYDPMLRVRDQMTENDYRHGESTSINHFYEKLLKLKEGLHTESAKHLSERRHRLMEMYLTEFYKDWNGEHDLN